MVENASQNMVVAIVTTGSIKCGMSNKIDSRKI